MKRMADGPKFKAPPCPSCGACLAKMNETTVEAYEFDKHAGSYRHVDAGDSFTIDRPRCHADLAATIIGGLCTFSAGETETGQRRH